MSPLKVPWRSETLGPLGDLQGMSRDVACRLGSKLLSSLGIKTPLNKIPLLGHQR